MELSIRGPKENLFNILGKKAANTTSTFANSAIKAANVVSDFASDTTSTIADAAGQAVSAVNKAANTAMKNIPVLNSLLPAPNTGTRSNTSAARSNNSLLGSFGMNTTTVGNSGATNSGGIRAYTTPILIFLVIAGALTAVAMYFKDQISAGISKLLGKAPEVVAEVASQVTATEEAAKQAAAAAPAPTEESTSIFSKLTTTQSNEVFNVSTNDFTYYDAEPLCRALGAELASYDQVQKAYEKGADWCNYGWVKGQLAVYPTQQSTFEKLQGGPVDQHDVCGKPGLNGGYFDNPEMRFGVNCFGKKPAQSAADERALQEKGVLPRSPDTLKVDEQAQQFKEQLGSIPVLPFNDNTWSQA